MSADSRNADRLCCGRDELAYRHDVTSSVLTCCLFGPCPSPVLQEPVLQEREKDRRTAPPARFRKGLLRRGIAACRYRVYAPRVELHFFGCPGVGNSHRHQHCRRTADPATTRVGVERPILAATSVLAMIHLTRTEVKSTNASPAVSHTHRIDDELRLAALHCVPWQLAMHARAAEQERHCLTPAATSA